jgi:preprotein translocase subunit SecY
MDGLTDVGAFVIVCFCMIFAVVYGISEIRCANQTIKQLDKIKKRIDGMKPPEEE